MDRPGDSPSWAPLARLARQLLPAALGVALLPAPAAARTWDYVPSASVGGGYESNANSASQSSQEESSYVATAGAYLDITGETSTSRVGFRPEVRGAVYSGLSAASRDDSYLNYFLPVTVAQSWQTAQASLSAGYSRISTRDSIVIGFDPNNPPRPGIDTANRRTEYQERWYLSPSLRYQLTPRDLISLSLNYDDVTYTEAMFSFRTDYTAGAAELSWDHSLGQRSTVSLSANISTFEATRPQSPVRNDTLTYGLTAGYQYALTPAATVGLTAGSSRSEVDIKGLPWISTPAGLLPCLDAAHNVFVPCTIRSTGDNFIGEVFYRQRPEKTVTTELRLSRAIQPSSDGSQVTVDQVAAYLTKEVTPLLSVRLAGQYWKQDAVTRQANALSDRFRRDYYSLEASATRRLNRSWSVGGQYTFTNDQRDYDVVASSTPNHRLYFYIQYSGLGSH